MFIDEYFYLLHIIWPSTTKVNDILTNTIAQLTIKTSF